MISIHWASLVIGGVVSIFTYELARAGVRLLIARVKEWDKK